MCVIAQTPLISPFGSIGFREREKEREGRRREGERLQGTQRGDEEKNIWKKSEKLKLQ